jgi:hypothetical protein
MDDGLPRDDRGLRPCEWCGGTIQQPKIGRLRRYCRRTCRELAYRERATRRRIAQAVEEATAPESSVDETAPPRSERQ